MSDLAWRSSDGTWRWPIIAARPPRHGLVAGDVAARWWWAAWCNAWGAIGCSYGAEMALALALERSNDVHPHWGVTRLPTNPP